MGGELALRLKTKMTSLASAGKSHLKTGLLFEYQLDSSGWVGDVTISRSAGTGVDIGIAPGVAFGAAGVTFGIAVVTFNTYAPPLNEDKMFVPSPSLAKTAPEEKET